MQMNPYLNFKGDCEAAFQFYERCLGAKLGPIFRYDGSPMAGEVPAAFREKIMHGSVTVGDQVLMGADVLPERYEVPKGFSLSLQIKSAEEAERVFRELGQGGEAVMPQKEDVLGRAIRGARGSVWSPMDHQLRRSMNDLANHALQRPRPWRSGCNRGVSWAGSLSLGRSSKGNNL